MNKDLKKIKKALEAQGFECVTTKGNHLLVLKRGQRITTFASTPSDLRSWKNSLAKAKRAGFEWP